ncbi:MAG: HWE histidine kinase domain-containing protein [Hyphomicrobiaceae bacterium]
MAQHVDLTSCDVEPIHLPGRIQPHGCLLVCEHDASRVIRCSVNARQMLGLVESPIGKTLTELFGIGTAHNLLNALSRSNDPRRPGLLFSLEMARGAGRYDVAAHRHGEHALFEFLPAATVASTSVLDLTRMLIARTGKLASISEISDRLPRLIQAVLGYDRVMLYEFAPDGSGKVIGEAKKPDLESFLGQHFPASDVPRQARELYVKNAIRVIVDVNEFQSDLIPHAEESSAPVDLSFAQLRSVSPIHLEYLRNMGVSASMSLSIVVGDELWGLVACHHYRPRTITMEQWLAAEMFVEFLSILLTATHHQQRFDTAVRTRRLLDGLMAEMTFQESLDAFLRKRLPMLKDLIPSDGIGLWLDGIWVSHGSAPPPSAVPALARFLRESGESSIYATDSLAGRFDEARTYKESAAGLLAVPLSQIPGDYLMFFRRELVRAVEWAGDPTKSYATGPLGDRLTPRKSFAIWREMVEGRSLHWSEDDRNAGEAARTGLRDVLMRQNELLAAERQSSEIRQKILNDELNHRVKNILALIKALVSQSRDKDVSLESFVDTLRGRIMALSFAHDQTLRANGGNTLHRLVMAELSPYPQDQIDIDGDDVGLGPRAFSVVALVLHELATNAVKYGALQSSSGKLTIRSRLSNDGDLAIEWSERGGPPVAPPSAGGFGSVLLNRSVPFDLGGTSEVNYEPQGVTARFVIPRKFVSAPVEPGEDVVETARISSPAGSAIDGQTVLVVEDQLVISLDVEDMLKSMGAGSVLSVASSEEALGLLARQRPSLAILDINLGSGTSFVVADELTRLSIGFVFATGYGGSAIVPPRLSHVPILRKPYSSDDIREAFGRLADLASQQEPPPATC